MARSIAPFPVKFQSSVLCLPPAKGDIPECGVVVSSPAQPTRKPVEHAGHVYQQRLIKTFAISPPSYETGPLSDDASDKSKPDKTEPRATSQEAASSLASKLAVGSDDLYELLELGDKRWHATADDIKKNFRRLSLTYHPDKISHLGEEARSNAEAHFKSVMKAYDILSDKKRRAAYDSIDDVDDTIPSERDATGSPARFYEKFSSCFALNARWSVSDRVPSLGDDETDIDSVNKFYDFWFAFKSWRDFSFDVEFDTDQAESREEKRWMERQNAKHIKAKKLEESARIGRLVDLAYKHDPRLVKARNAAKAKKDAVKQERRRIAEENARQQKEREEAQRVETERKAAEEKLRRAEAKKERDAARQVVRKARQKLRAAARELALTDTDRGLIAVERMCSDGIVESLEAVAQIITQLDVSCASATTEAIEILEKALLNPQEPLRLADSHSHTNGNSDPPSSPAAVLSQKPESSPSKPETAPPLTPQADEKKSVEAVWSAEELSLLSKAVAKFPGGTRDRWVVISEFIGTKRPEDVLKRVNDSRASKIKPSDLGSRPSSANTKQADAQAFERFQEKRKGKALVPQNKPKTATANPDKPPNKLNFTPREQTLFETALKKYPSSEGQGRWKKVSEAVGRRPSECHDRFNELISFFRARKESS